MKKFILNLLRRACGTTHILNEIEQMKNIIAEKNMQTDQIAHQTSCKLSEIEQLKNIIAERKMQTDQAVYQINCNLLQLTTKMDKYQIQLRPSDKPLCLYASKYGLSFSNVEGNENLPEIVIVTLPKSGTYFWGKILSECGYQDLEIHAGECMFADYRTLTLRERLDSPPDAECVHWLPFYLQLSLLHKGQYLLGHLSFSCSPYLNGKNFFITVRDLRTVIVSWLRFCQKRSFHANDSWYGLGSTEEGVFTFLNSSYARDIIYYAKELVQWVSAFPDRVLRFEALDSPDSKEFSHIVDTLSALTGLDAETVNSAIGRARGTSTMTYSGKPSSTQGIWSERIEEVFCAHGLDLLNEKLGYSRTWER